MTYHILNGDALADRFPQEIQGNKIIMRECLVDGPIKAASFEEFLKIRSAYLDTTYKDQALVTYDEFVLPELQKLNEIEHDSNVYLWFEEDVFCQVNTWFICFLLEQHIGEQNIFFVIPDTNVKMGFAGLDEHDLIIAYEKAMKVSGVELIELAKLWEAYKAVDIVRMRELTNELHKFDWIKTAVDAEIDRIVEQTPTQILTSLIKQLGSDKFGPVFQEFSKLAPIYGYGDLMVKRMFDEIVANQKT